MTGTRRAVSLAEILVVTVIIAVLAALLLSSLSLVRGAARSVRCASALRQLALASQGYSVDNRGLLIDWSKWRIDIIPYVESNQDTMALDRTTKAGGSVLQDCPSWMRNYHASSGSTGFGYASRGQGYTMNPVPGRDNDQPGGGTTTTNSCYAGTPGGAFGTSGQFKPMHGGAVTHRSQRYQFADADTWLCEPVPSRMVTAENTKTGGPRHRGGRLNVAFFDGRTAGVETRESRIWQQQGDVLLWPYVVSGPVTLRYPEPGSAIWRSIYAPGRAGDP